MAPEKSQETNNPFGLRNKLASNRECFPGPQATSRTRYPLKESPQLNISA